MTFRILRRITSVGAIALALSAQGMAQPAINNVSGEIEDYTATLDANGPWHLTGEWSVGLMGASGKADFAAALSMVRSNNETRAAHTHHVTISNGVVTELANGFRINGNAVIATNGSLAGFSGSPLEVVVTGGNAVELSNVTLTFGGGAAGHFGSAPVHGVVSGR